MTHVRIRRRWLAGLILALTFAALGAMAYALTKPDPDRLFQEARADLAAGDADGASRSVSKLAQLRPPNPFDRLLRAQVADATGRLDDAVAELAFIEDRHPLAPVARLLTGQIEVRRGRLRPAESAFLATLALEPRSPQPRRELVYLYNLQHRQRELDAQLSAMSEQGPLDYEYLVHWAKTRNVVWNPERDCEVLAKCVQADPGDRLSRLALAEGLRRMNKRSEAWDILAPLGESDSDARPIRAMLCLDQGDESEFDRWLSGAPDDDPKVAPLRGQIALEEGRWRDAIRTFRLAYAADPTDRSILSGLGNALRQAGENQSAEPLLDAARKYDAVTPLVTKATTLAGEQDPTLATRIAEACEGAGRFPEAIAWYRQAIARDPLDVKAQEGLARLTRARPGVQKSDQ